MFLSELKIWNFRKYSSGEGDAPGLHLKLNRGLNLLVGENDSGKTTIIDAVKFVLQTQSYDYQRLEEEDFFLQPGIEPTGTNRTKSLKIECMFRGFDAENNEAANFLEWLGIEKNKDGHDQYFLKVTLNAERKDRKISYDIKAGPDDEGTQLDGVARDFLRTTYLKPLRDAESELTPGRRSRLAQILKSHESFSSVLEPDHTITKIAERANKQIEGYFRGKDENNSDIQDQSGKNLLSDINEYLREFFTEKEINKIAKFTISGQSLSGILEKLILNLTEENSGLGSYNRLYIATELLLLKRSRYHGLKLSLIEEVEAHLHPQAQLRLIEYLQNEIADKFAVQLIMTTHSPNLASKVKLDNLIICKDDQAFPMGSDFTELEKGDYLFLERFLDVTRANLFFAQGIILVEGDAENILIPVIADLLDKPLTKHGVSVVNVQSTAFLRYSKIFPSFVFKLKALG
jgi:putative ATP-dependent endonuclease of OLD family